MVESYRLSHSNRFVIQKRVTHVDHVVQAFLQLLRVLLESSEWSFMVPIGTVGALEPSLGTVNTVPIGTLGIFPWVLCVPFLGYAGHPPLGPPYPWVLLGP